eukprot:TRINITY_DN77632_c0_g1_i1.p1 TRINITY_DN77632_c0_g1~~TRINITY_DN77632_c0_g1_i1.p1  ORF type:complete len:310 (-),score=50.13 TRINITY_DN77632_c0_g1_i1:44-973(-)
MKGSWWRCAFVVLIVSLALATNPGWNEDHFNSFLRTQSSFVLAHRMAAAVGLIEAVVQNFGVFSLGHGHGRLFLGVFDQWIELPRGVFHNVEWPDVHDVDMIGGAFLLVYALWKILPSFAHKNFSASWANLRSFRLWVLATALFSHERFEHLLINTLLLYSVAPALHDMLGRPQFLALYLAGGAVAVVVSLCLNPWLRRVQFVEYVGASASLYALLGFLAGENGEVLFMGRHWQWLEFVIIQVIIDYCMGVDAVAHMSGWLVGFLAAEYDLLIPRARTVVFSSQDTTRSAFFSGGSGRYWSDKWINSAG